MIDANNPSYYRAHQYKGQLDLPNSAFKNRDLQSFPSAIPQGKQYFQQSNKKHFVHKFNRSQIQQDNVLHQYPQQQVRNSRIAFEPSYFRSLNVDDIQGTRPNTLISQAIKNRQKAAYLMKNQHEPTYLMQSKPLMGAQNPMMQSRQIQPQYIEAYSHNKPLIYKQNEAVNKFKKSKSILQNSSANVLNNFVSRDNSYKPIVNLKDDKIENQQKEKKYNYGNNFHYRGLSKVATNNLQNIETLQSDEEQHIQRQVKKSQLKQQRIYEIENELLSNLNFKANNHLNQELLKKNKTQRDTPYLNNRSTFHLQNGSHNNTINVDNRNSYNEQNQYQSVKLRNETNQSYVDSLSPSRLSSNHFQHQQIYNNRIDTQNSSQFAHNNISPKIDKSNIRKFNPTFLSFQSQTITRHHK